VPATDPSCHGSHVRDLGSAQRLDAAARFPSLLPRRWWRGLVGLGCGLAVACSSESTSSTPAGPPPAVVEAVTLSLETVHERIELVGQLDADESVVLKPEMGGVIDEVAFDEGQEVEAGALLFRLRDSEQRAVLAAAEADRVLAERAHGRARQLMTQGVLAGAELDRVIAERDAARARVEHARVNLERTEIRAPFAGMLGARLVSPGDRVSPETALVRLDAVARLKLVFTLPEIVVGLAQLGTPLTVRVAPWPDESFAGAVYFVAPAVEAQSRRLLVKAYIQNQARRLRPGMFANVRLEVAEHRDRLLVPESALVQDAAGTFVWRIAEDGTAARAPIEVGLRRDGRVEAVSGLGAGDRVVSAGTHKIAPGTPLRVVPPAEEGRPP
jgi:membrane fusion protein (multidrug efflux system)